jgi:hypothetical protein
LRQAARAVVDGARDQGRDDCMDDLVDEQLIEHLRQALDAPRPNSAQADDEERAELTGLRLLRREVRHHGQRSRCGCGTAIDCLEAILRVESGAPGSSTALPSRPDAYDAIWPIVDAHWKESGDGRRSAMVAALVNIWPTRPRRERASHESVSTAGATSAGTALGSNAAGEGTREVAPRETGGVVDAARGSRSDGRVQPSSVSVATALEWKLWLLDWIGDDGELSDYEIGNLAEDIAARVASHAPRGGKAPPRPVVHGCTHEPSHAIPEECWAARRIGKASPGDEYREALERIAGMAGRDTPIWCAAADALGWARKHVPRPSKASSWGTCKQHPGADAGCGECLRDLIRRLEGVRTCQPSSSLPSSADPSPSASSSRSFDIDAAYPDAFVDEDPGTCTKCGAPFELVRPGKSQPTCRCWHEPDDADCSGKAACNHVWTRTGSDTLFCFGCQAAINEPEDK